MQTTALYARAVCFWACFLQLGRIEAGSYSHLKRTVPEFVWKRTETTSSAGSRCGCLVCTWVRLLYSHLPKRLEKWLQESNFSWYLLQIWNINSWDMWLSTHYFSGFLQDWFHVFLYEIKRKFSVVQFDDGWWIVKPKGSSFQRHQNCVCGTLKSGTVTILS